VPTLLFASCEIGHIGSGSFGQVASFCQAKLRFELRVFILRALTLCAFKSSFEASSIFFVKADTANRGAKGQSFGGLRRSFCGTILASWGGKLTPFVRRHRAFEFEVFSAVKVRSRLKWLEIGA